MFLPHGRGRKAHVLKRVWINHPLSGSTNLKQHRPTPGGVTLGGMLETCEWDRR
jgi:hypothetical protein